MCSCFLYESQNTQRLFPCKTLADWFFFIIEMKSVYCAVRTGSLNKTAYVSSLKGQNSRPSKSLTCNMICEFILIINQHDAQNLFYNKFVSCLYMFRARVLIVRRSKLYYTVSGIIIPIGGRPVHGTPPVGVMIPDAV